MSAVLISVVERPRLNWAVILGLMAALALVGQVGDLAQSMLKRALGVKDSGTIMPGHGGLFDRLDALFFILPFALWASFSLGPG